MKYLSEQQNTETRKTDYDVESVNIIVEMPVPVAIIVCEGDFKTIEHISRALENKLPVIIMKGSGMAADLVSERLEKYVS